MEGPNEFQRFPKFLEMLPYILLFLYFINYFFSTNFGVYTTGQCPVHPGTPSQTLHLREFSEALHYNSPDCPVHHQTVSGAPGESDSELASFGSPLR